mmetsp:Transcript_10683/g.15425  ORF Transcript_10683/g.15425 Transcript_10683/m.15425 type:complete len:428 (-) Transcript_10683:84-1367(-)
MRQTPLTYDNGIMTASAGASSSNQFQVTGPLFAPALSVSQSNAAENFAAFFNLPVEDAIDVDYLLAEYLLDDIGNGSSQGPWGLSATPPMMYDARAPAQLATPEDETGQQEEGPQDVSFADVAAGGTFAKDIAQVQQMIAQHAARAQATVEARTCSSLALPPVAVEAAASPAAAMKRPAPEAAVAATSGKRRPKSEAQVTRRRERNRILARHTRLRKKFFFEGLQKEVMDLQREHNALKIIVQSNLDQNVANEILKDSNIELPSVVMENCDTEDAADLDRQDFSLVKSLQFSQQCFVITDPSLQDNPIVYASEDFLTLTRYTREEILGRNCRFLQGPDTNAEKVEAMRKAISAGQDISVCIANYTADGEIFWNQLFVAALRDVEDNIVNFVGVCVKVSRPAPDDPEYNKILPAFQEAKETQETAQDN